MEILKDLNGLLNVVQKHAKFQKVLLCYDNQVANFNIMQIYQTIKEHCIFNQMSLQKLNFNELNNGYKLVIFLCSANSFLKANLNCADFVCIFMPTDSNILPFFVNQQNMLQTNNFLFLKNAEMDINILFSVYFNRFYNYLKDMLFMQESNINFEFNIKAITQKSLLNLLNTQTMEFVDLKLLKVCNIDYKFLPAIDCLLLQGFLWLTNAIRQNNLALVDVYKAMKDNLESVNYYYNLATDKVFLEIVNLNFFNLNQILTQSLQLTQILPLTEKLTKTEFEKIKEFCKNDKNLLNYLYLYNFFEE